MFCSSPGFVQFRGSIKQGAEEKKADGVAVHDPEEDYSYGVGRATKLRTWVEDGVVDVSQACLFLTDKTEQTILIIGLSYLARPSGHRC